MRTLTVSTLIVLIYVLWAGSASSQELPQVPEGGLLHYKVSDCTDNESGEVGECVISVDRNNNVYMTFLQNERIQFIRKITGDGYEELYMRDTFNTF